MGMCSSTEEEANNAHGAADSPAPEDLPKDQTNKWKDEKAHAGKILQGFVGGCGSGQEFDTFSEALDELFCATGHVKGGITQGPNGKYTIRAGTDLKDAPSQEEVSWLKADLGNTGTKLETQHVLIGAPPVGPLPQTFRTFSEAVDFLFADSTAKLCAGAGGITQQPDGKFTIRTGLDLKASEDGEVSWLKDDLRDLKDHLSKTNSSWYESDRGPWMAN